MWIAAISRRGQVAPSYFFLRRLRRVAVDQSFHAPGVIRKILAEIAHGVFRGAFRFVRMGDEIRAAKNHVPDRELFAAAHCGVTTWITRGANVTNRSTPQSWQ